MSIIDDIAKKAGVSTTTVYRVLNEKEGVNHDTRNRVKEILEKYDYQKKPKGKIKKDDVNIHDVAKEAGVSSATVSRVINNIDVVLPETRKKVEDAINKLNYHPNINARILRKIETSLIGLIVPDISNQFFSNIVEGIENIACKKSYSVVLFNTKFQKAREKKAIKILNERKADGAIYMGKSIDENKMDLLNNCDFPIIIISREEKIIDFPTVNIDNKKAAYDMTNYLISQGHKKIAFISGPLNDKTAGMRRLNGYKSALKDHNLNYICWEEGDFTLKGGYQASNRIIRSSIELPTAIFAADDRMAMGTMSYLKENNYKIPGDISVTGFDDIELTKYTIPKLTTVSQPIIKMGMKGMEQLYNLIKGKSLSEKNITLEHKLIIRDSG